MKWNVLALPKFNAQFELIKSKIRRADEFMEGAKWILERDALRGVTVCENPPVFALGINAMAEKTAISVYYTVSFQNVYLLSIATSSVKMNSKGRIPSEL